MLTASVSIGLEGTVLIGAMKEEIKFWAHSSVRDDADDKYQHVRMLTASVSIGLERTVLIGAMKEEIVVWAHSSVG